MVLFNPATVPRLFWILFLTCSGDGWKSKERLPWPGTYRCLKRVQVNTTHGNRGFPVLRRLRMRIFRRMVPDESGMTCLSEGNDHEEGNSAAVFDNGVDLDFAACGRTAALPCGRCGIRNGQPPVLEASEEAAAKVQEMPSG